MAAEEQQTIDGTAEEVDPKPADLAATDEPADFEPTAAELVISDPQDEVAVFRVLDHHDELAILERLQGKLIDKLAYSFPLDGKTATELSVQGVFECVMAMNDTGKVQLGIDRDVRPEWGIELQDTDYAGDVEHVICTVYARDAVTGIGVNGTASQPRKIKMTEAKGRKRKKDGKYVPDDLIVTDPFARQKALNKAERNALRKLVPEFIAQTLLAQYEGNTDAVLGIKAGPGAQPDLPPPLDDEEAVALTAEIEAIYTEIREKHSRTRILPRRYQHELSRAAHSHEMLRGLRDALQGTLEDEQRKAAA